MEVAFNDGLLRITRTDQPPGLRLDGEVDQANTAAFAQALTSVIQMGGDVHLNLAGLQLIHLNGLRLLVQTATELPTNSRLILDALPSHLHRIVRLAGWDETPGLQISSHRPLPPRP